MTLANLLQGVAASRKEAAALGLRLYMGGVCVNGHRAPRRARSGRCTACPRSNKLQSSGDSRRALQDARFQNLARDDVAISRDVARATGVKFYLGRPCCNGHYGIRYAAHRSCVDCLREQQKRFSAQYPDKQASYSQAYNTRHPAKRYSITKAWKSRNPEHAKMLAHRGWHARRVRGSQVEGRLNALDLERLKQLQNGCCAYCGASARLSLDHKKPVSRGGSNHILNLQYLCVSHNSSKRDMDDKDYRRLKGIPERTQWGASSASFAITGAV